jgi:hypothetical protein
MGSAEKMKSAGKKERKMSKRKYFFIIQAGGSVSWGNPKKIHSKPKEILPQNPTGNLNLR